MNVLCRDLQSASAHLRHSWRRKTWGYRRGPAHRSSKRSMHDLHKPRELNYPIEGGVGDFLPPEALRTVVEWQDGLLERLNEQVSGTELAGSDVLQTIADSAKKEEHILAHNYACLAANNSFFLDGIKPRSENAQQKEKEMNSFNGILNTQFAGIDSLKERFVASASGMVSSGWLWLVTDLQAGLAVIPTFGAGTLLVRSRTSWSAVEQSSVVRQTYMSKPLDTSRSGSGLSSIGQSGSLPSSPASGVKAAPYNLNPNTPSRSFAYSAFSLKDYDNPSVRDSEFATSGSSAQRLAYQRGSRLYPLLVLSLFEHTWMSAGLGVWGKEEYVRRFFDVIDWERVNRIYAKFTSNKKLIMQEKV